MEQDKHPSWFKLRIERRELLRTLPPEAAVKIVLACLDYLDTMEQPENLSELEKIGFAVFLADLDEAWSKYTQRVNARKNKSNDIGRYRTISHETEVEVEEETEVEVETEVRKKKDIKADKPPSRHRFIPPGVEDVRAYCVEQGYSIDPERFVDYYTANGWMAGRNHMKDWKAAVRNWAKNEKGEKNGKREFAEDPVSEFGTIGTRL